jgi:hypothetical protein
VIHPLSRGSMAHRSKISVPALSRPNSTNFTLDELISKPNMGAGFRLNNDPKETKTIP